MTNELPEKFREELTKCDIPVTDEQLEKLIAYYRLLLEWNEKINLTRHTEVEKFVARDVLDSWQLAQLLDEKVAILDVGTGGGVPGIILKILRKDLKVAICDSVGKKATAVSEIVAAMGIQVDVLHGRAEDVLDRIRFDVLVVRAVARMKKILTWLRDKWQFFDRLLLVKGPAWVDERGESRHYGLLTKHQLRKLAEYTAPGLETQSVILEIKRKPKK